MLLKEGTKQETIHLNALEKDHVEGYDLNVPTLQMNANSSAEVMNNQNSMFHGSIDNNSSINTSQLMPSTLNPNGSVDTSTNMLDGISDLDSIRSNKVDFFDMNHPMWWNEYVLLNLCTCQLLCWSSFVIACSGLYKVEWMLEKQQFITHFLFHSWNRQPII